MARRVLVAAALVALARPSPPPSPPATPAPPPAPPDLAPCPYNVLCYCRADHFACNNVPFHRFPDTEAGVAHVSVSSARLLALGEAALDARRLRTLVLAGCALQHIERAALQSMVSTLASLDLGFNEFTEVPLESLRELKVLNWLNLQNNYISELNPGLDWGYLGDSLSSLSLSNNQLTVVLEGALTPLRRLAQLELDGNRLSALAPGALPAALHALRLGGNLLRAPPCALLARLPRLRQLQLRENELRAPAACAPRLDALDLSHNLLDDTATLKLRHASLRHLVLDYNTLTALPLLTGVRLERLSLAHNRVRRLPAAALYALRRSLRRLDLEHNELHALPGALRSLVRLRVLSLSHNWLQEVPVLPPGLRSLSLAGNQLAHAPAGLRGLAPSSLVFLDLGYNRIEALHADEFGAWADALTTLHLKGNRLSQLVGEAFPSQLPLRELQLSFTELGALPGMPPGALSALHALELTSALLDEFPALSLPALAWLTLDNNNIHHVTTQDILNFPSLEYLNLDFNKIEEFPSEVVPVNGSSKLKELRLSYNYISRLNCEYFLDLKELQSVDVSYNILINLTQQCFTELSNLVHLSLVGNLLEFVHERTFYNLPRLEVLELQDNRLEELSTEYFENVSSEATNLSVNVSYNRISTLVGSGRSVLINVLDLSHNQLRNLSKNFFDSFGQSLRQLILSNNRLAHIDNLTFGSLARLAVLSLHDNDIGALKRRAFAELSALQSLDLSRNRLAQLSVEQFTELRHLRYLSLAHNLLRALPRDVFRNTLLEHLDLSDNQLTVYPASALAQVGFTLRRLELARNHLEYLDAAMFRATAFLHELGLARNALTVLADNTLAALARLRRLDLSYNNIKTNYKELFHNVPRLRRLALAGVGLRTLPALPLSRMTELDLSGNLITALREVDSRRLAGLQVLLLARNRLSALHPGAWAALPALGVLDVSHNPVVRVPLGTFDGLGHLLRLRMDHLAQLEALEPNAFLPLSSLRALSISSGGAVPLRDIVACTPALEALELHMRESVLDAQLAGLVAPRLRTLEVRGRVLRRVEAHALAALGRQRALLLRVHDTGARSLPAGLLAPLADVPQLALELTDSALDTLSPDLLYRNMTDWTRFTTKLLPGGLVVSGNPLRCGCEVQWLSAWLRRWVGEVAGGGAAARGAARSSTCVTRGGSTRALLALGAGDAACSARALAGRAAVERGARALAAAAWLVLVHALR